MAATSLVRAGRMVKESVTAPILRTAARQPRKSEAQVRGKRNVLAENVPGQEVLHHAVPDLGVLRLQDPVVFVRVEEEPVAGLPLFVGGELGAGQQFVPEPQALPDGNAVVLV